MAFSIVRCGLLRTSKDILERNVALGAVNVFHGVKDNDVGRSPTMRTMTTATAIALSNLQFLDRTKNSSNGLVESIRRYSKKPATARQQDESDSDSDSDDEYERKRLDKKSKTSERGDSEFWRRKMRTLHRILDVNRDGVISFDDFNLLAKRFNDLGHLTPEVAAEFNEVLKQTWEEQFGEITKYNLVTAEQFLVDLHHRLNDKKMAKRLGRFLPYLFKAVDYDHTGHLDLEQYKLFFRCLGLSDENAAISFAVIDKNGDGQVSMKEFVHLGRQYFLTEDETKISKMFWGPLIDH